MQFLVMILISFHFVFVVCAKCQNQNFFFQRKLTLDSSNSFSEMLRTIRDPEKPSTLEDLKVVYEDGIIVQPPTSDNVQVVCYRLLFYWFIYRARCGWVGDRNRIYGIFFCHFSFECQQVRVEFNPTVPHCSLATLIGLCLRIKIERNITQYLKLDIYIKKGAHSTEDESK